MAATQREPAKRAVVMTFLCRLAVIGTASDRGGHVRTNYTSQKQMSEYIDNARLRRVASKCGRAEKRPESMISTCLCYSCLASSWAAPKTTYFRHRDLARNALPLCRSLFLQTPTRVKEVLDARLDHFRLRLTKLSKDGVNLF